MSLSIKTKFFKNTAVVSVFTMFSRIFGYIRDAAIFIFISNSTGALDAFLVAFRVPNFFRRIFGEGALSTAYIPILSDYKNNKSPCQKTLSSPASAVVTNVKKSYKPKCCRPKHLYRSICSYLSSLRHISISNILRCANPRRCHLA